MRKALSSDCRSTIDCTSVPLKPAVLLSLQACRRVGTRLKELRGVRKALFRQLQGFANAGSLSKGAVSASVAMQKNVAAESWVGCLRPQGVTHPMC